MNTENANQTGDQLSTEKTSTMLASAGVGGGPSTDNSKVVNITIENMGTITANNKEQAMEDIKEVLERSIAEDGNGQDY